MNDRLRGLDSYITDSRHHKFTTNEECVNCECKWEARCEGEFGRSYFVDDDGFCPECGLQVEN